MSNGSQRPTFFAEGFLTLLRAMLQSMVRGELSQRAFRAILVEWGEELGRKTVVSESVNEVWDQLDQLLSLLNFTRDTTEQQAIERKIVSELKRLEFQSARRGYSSFHETQTDMPSTERYPGGWHDDDERREGGSSLEALLLPHVPKDKSYGLESLVEIPQRGQTPGSNSFYRGTPQRRTNTETRGVSLQKIEEPSSLVGGSRRQKTPSEPISMSDSLSFESHPIENLNISDGESGEADLLRLDYSGLKGTESIVKLSKAVARSEKTLIEIRTSAPDFEQLLSSWCAIRKFEIIQRRNDKESMSFVIQGTS